MSDEFEFEGREVRYTERAAEVGPVGGDSNYGGETIAFVPVAIEAATPQQASARIDELTRALGETAARFGGRLAIEDRDAPCLLEAAAIMVPVWRDQARRYLARCRVEARRRARDN